jgi:ribosomal protein L11 methyltransferase
MKPSRRVEKRLAKKSVSKRGPRARPLYRLVIKVAPEAADVAGALLVRAGSGGAMQEELPREARISSFGESKALLMRLGSSVVAALGELGVRALHRVGRAPRAFDAWRTAWTRSLEPVRISDETWLVPTNKRAKAGDETSIWLEPSLSFGFGEHATTRMAAAAVERLCRDGARSVLDFGTGSGVLCLVAVHAGASEAVGLDVDPDAVIAARRNAALNHMTRCCTYGRASVRRIRSAFDVVVANVDRSTLTEMANALGVRVAARGRLLLTGFLVEDARWIRSVYRAQGFRVTKRLFEDDFCLFELERTRRASRTRP